MKCPTCTSTLLVMSERKGVEIDYCPQCRGVWLDRGELDKLLERADVQAAAQPPVQAAQYRNEHHQAPSYPPRDYEQSYSGHKSITSTSHGSARSLIDLHLYDVRCGDAVPSRSHQAPAFASL